MSVLGVGVDVVSLERCEEKLALHPALAEGICAEGETPPGNAKAFARRWALKEATIKSCGEKLTPRQVHVSHNPDGAPEVRVVARGYEQDLFLASVSDDAGVAVAVCYRIRSASA